jgi:hypothetical protein
VQGLSIDQRNREHAGCKGSRRCPTTPMVRDGKVRGTDASEAAWPDAPGKGEGEREPKASEVETDEGYDSSEGVQRARGKGSQGEEMGKSDRARDGTQPRGCKISHRYPTTPIHPIHIRGQNATSISTRCFTPAGRGGSSHVPWARGCPFWPNTSRGCGRGGGVA